MKLNRMSVKGIHGDLHGDWGDPGHLGGHLIRPRREALPKIRTSRATRTALCGDQASVRARRRRCGDSRLAPLHIQGCERCAEVASRFPATAGNRCEALTADRDTGESLIAMPDRRSDGRDAAASQQSGRRTDEAKAREVVRRSGSQWAANAAEANHL